MWMFSHFLFICKYLSFTFTSEWNGYGIAVSITHLPLKFFPRAPLHWFNLESVPEAGKHHNRSRGWEPPGTIYLSASAAAWLWSRWVGVGSRKEAVWFLLPSFYLLSIVTFQEKIKEKEETEYRAKRTIYANSFLVRSPY